MKDYYIYHSSNDYVSHHGILGMKWGIRRYQNKDGTYTREGLFRRGKKRKRSANEVERDRRAQQRKNLRTMSDEQLNKEIARLQKEAQYKELSNQDLHPAKAATSKALDKYGNQAIGLFIGSASTLATFAIKALIAKKINANPAKAK